MIEPWTTQDSEHYKTLMLKEFGSYKERGESKHACFLRIKMAELYCEKSGCASEHIQGMIAAAMAALEEVYADIEITKEAALQALYTYSRKKIEYRKVK